MIPPKTERNRLEIECKHSPYSFTFVDGILLKFRNDVIDCLTKVDDQSRNPELRTMVPMQILLDIDNAKNPMNVTRERLERAATENQFMNGKIQAIQVCFCLDILRVLR
jgi:hypothetical protein